MPPRHLKHGTNSQSWTTFRMPRTQRKFIHGLTVAATIVVLLAGCATTPKFRVPLAELPPEQAGRAERNLVVFNAAWDLVNRKHYDPKYHGVAPTDDELKAALQEIG